jgi:hypothetical protein
MVVTVLFHDAVKRMFLKADHMVVMVVVVGMLLLSATIM